MLVFDLTFKLLMFDRWRRLKAQMIEKRSKLGESQTLQQFSRDVDEIEAWISEKLQTATDESYKDPTNIQVHIWLLLAQAILTDIHSNTANLKGVHGIPSDRFYGRNTWGMDVLHNTVCLKMMQASKKKTVLFFKHSSM